MATSVYAFLVLVVLVRTRVIDYSPYDFVVPFLAGLGVLLLPAEFLAGFVLVIEAAKTRLHSRGCRRRVSQEITNHRQQLFFLFSSKRARRRQVFQKSPNEANRYTGLRTDPSAGVLRISHG